MPKYSRSDYIPIKDLGKGTYGNVYLVKRVSNGERLVMKVVDVRNLDSRQRENAMREVQFLKKFNHPFIVAYKESFIESNKLCIVMDYCDSGDLLSVIDKNIKDKTYIAEAKILRWLVQMLLGLRSIHNNKCLHRDLKPQNLLLDSSGRLRIADFGVSKNLENTLALAHSVIGTPYYFSPELSQGKPYAWASDMWALGCLVYELATLHPPFHKAKNMPELIELIKNMRIPPVPSVYSLEFQALVTRMLIRDYDKRASCSELLKTKKLSEITQQMLSESSPIQVFMIELHNKNELNIDIVNRIENVSESDASIAGSNETPTKKGQKYNQVNSDKLKKNPREAARKAIMNL